MAVNTKAIKRRLKSVKNTKKITKAMELVAAAKMRHAVEAAVNTRAYATLAWQLLTTLSRTETITLPLLEVREVKKILLLLITSNRGLCGSFNSNVIRKTLREMEGMGGLPVDIVAVGKKGADAARRAGRQLTGFISDLPDTPGMSDVLPIARIATDGYGTKTYDKVFVGYTDYQSALRQIPRVRQVLPVSRGDLERMITESGGDTAGNAPIADVLDEYLFEPNPLSVLELMLPRLVEMQIYQAILESAASEHSARMLAMRTASDAAGDMIDELNLTYNKARQAGITQEIAEIAGGAAALG